MKKYVCKICRRRFIKTPAYQDHLNSDSHKQKLIEFHSSTIHPNGECTCSGEGKCDWCKTVDISLNNPVWR